MTLTEAAAKINAAADLSATAGRAVVFVQMYGRDIGRLTQADIDNLGHTPTGWGKKALSKGAAQVWHALHD